LICLDGFFIVWYMMVWIGHGLVHFWSTTSEGLGMDNLVTVYPFQGYDIHTDEIQRSNRYASREWITRHGFEVAGPGARVPETDLDDGLSPRGYDPNSQIRGGFQGSVK
jgi:hypothetical protein